MQAANISKEQMIDSQRIYGGSMIQNRWFLKALSMVAVESRVFKEVNCLDPATFMEFSECGLYIFKFFKRGQPVYVIIDDLLPCIKDGSG